MNDPTIDLVRRFAALLDSGRLADLDDLLTPDCRDANPTSFQGPGRAGVAFKVAWYLAANPGARTHFLDLARAEDGVVAEWITEFRDGSVSRHRGHFTILGERIAAFETTHVG
jgi:hypothetical protein